MDENDWAPNGEIHNGAHYPTCVFTSNRRGAKRRTYTVMGGLAAWRLRQCKPQSRQPIWLALNRLDPSTAKR
eukprot:12416866-Karenia_brevis.AAC.1